MEKTLKIADDAYNREPEFWNQFIEVWQKTLNRMVVGAYKYHYDKCSTVHEDIDDETKMLFTRQRMSMYDGGGEGEILCTCSEKGKKIHKLGCFLSQMKLNTGNTENLLDSINGLTLECISPEHKKAHFKSQTSAESPGITFKE